MEQQITCINCPVGCRLQVVVEDGEVKSVTGNSCNRGITYAKQECVAPQRMVTAVVPGAGRKCLSLIHIWSRGTRYFCIRRRRRDGRW